MDGEEANLGAPPLSSRTNLARPINLDSSSSSSSSSLSSSSFQEPDLLRDVQAYFKRHRSIGTRSSVNMLPRRCVPSLKETSKSTELSSGLKIETKRSTIGETQEDASLTPPSTSGTITNTFNEKYNLHGVHGREDQPAPSCKDVQPNILSHGDLKHAPVMETLKKVQFSVANSDISQGADDRKATRMDDLSSHMGSLAFTEMEWEAANQPESSKTNLNEPKQQVPARTNGHGGLRVDGGSSLGIRASVFPDQLHHLRNFLHTDVNHPITQSSVVGSSCATTTSVHATSAPMLNSTTYSSHPHKDSLPGRSITGKNLNSQILAQGDGVKQASSSVPSNRAISDKAFSGAQALNSVRDSPTEVKEVKEGNLCLQSEVSKDLSQCQDQPMKEKGNGADAPSTRQPSPTANNSSSNPKIEPAKSEKQEKPPSRKRGYDPDMFFKVNGKLYQRLGKIGSGGSSEVHKVISSDCKIYALKKIRLKGRDYATAFGFCQEISYLDKLKGKNNIIQLIDYEVTDKALLQEVKNGYISNKDSKVKDDGYIYMVLEHGEIDLAHMLSQKWKDIEGSNSTIDENWLRFFWQQILQAVNTIHEERIVHSDLKPANFLLVKGSLKLIDFGIAKAIMSDTTNIQRDAQVGTLSYMSPEAFMCNESDADGNVIKCGRPSDIWSLGCILYQMVYGRTPFSEYRTFWAKFKVITDPNHEIKYGPLSNPWLLDLMKKCLSWDRNRRWRIPELLEHPFLVPPIPHQIEGQNCNAIQLIAESCESNQKASALCSQIQQLIGNQTVVSRDEQCRLLLKISSVCQELQEEIAKNS